MSGYKFFGAIGLTMIMSCANAETRLDLTGGGFVTVDNDEGAITLHLPEKYRFEFDKFLVEQKATSDSLADFMNRFSEFLELRVAGHTDHVGSAEYNYKLGAERAKAVKLELAERGVDEERIELMSFGKDLPLYGQEHRVVGVDADKENRRVELAVRYIDN